MRSQEGALQRVASMVAGLQEKTQRLEEAQDKARGAGEEALGYAREARSEVKSKVDAKDVNGRPPLASAA